METPGTRLAGSNRGDSSAASSIYVRPIVSSWLGVTPSSSAAAWSASSERCLLCSASAGSKEELSDIAGEGTLTWVSVTDKFSSEFSEVTSGSGAGKGGGGAGSRRIKLKVAKTGVPA